MSAGSVEYSYDLDGFLITKRDGANITAYNYSSRGELLSVNFPDGRIIEYVHDPLGRRIARGWWCYGGEIPLAGTDPGFWQCMTGSNNLLMRFEYADGRMPVAMTKGGNTYYLTYDQVGSLRIVADSSGNVVKKIDYDSFGNVINDTNPTFTIPFWICGSESLYDRDNRLVKVRLQRL